MSTTARTTAHPFATSRHARSAAQVAYVDPWTVIEGIELVEAPAGGPTRLRVRFTTEAVPPFPAAAGQNDSHGAWEVTPER